MAVHLAKGTRDYLPEQMTQRLVAMDRLRDVFARHGFLPLGTPAFERTETLQGKYGDEGQKLTFRILKRGRGSERGETDLALRYDLTVPLARVMAMNPQIRLPFRRWQMAPVWRAERPARGRYREFYQCDADIVGAAGALAEAECLAVAAAGLEALGFHDFEFVLNDRRLLRGVAEKLGVADREVPLLVAVDKLDKIGMEGVSEELRKKEFAEDVITNLWALLGAGENGNLAGFCDALGEDGGAQADLEELMGFADALGVGPDRVRFDPTLARGLDYYTGPVFEIRLRGANMGSLGGGGRYDSLIGIFGKQKIEAVGICLGFERLLVLMEEEGRTLEDPNAIQCLVLVQDPELRGDAARLAAQLRGLGVRSDLYAGSGKLKHQFKFAHASGVSHVIVVGAREVESSVYTMKNMGTGEQVLGKAEELASHLRG